MEQKRKSYYYDCLKHGMSREEAEKLSQEAADSGAFFSDADHKACGGD